MVSAVWVRHQKKRWNFCAANAGVLQRYFPHDNRWRTLVHEGNRGAVPKANPAGFWFLAAAQEFYSIPYSCAQFNNAGTAIAGFGSDPRTSAELGKDSEAPWFQDL